MLLIMNAAQRRKFRRANPDSKLHYLQPSPPVPKIYPWDVPLSIAISWTTLRIFPFPGCPKCKEDLMLNMSFHAEDEHLYYVKCNMCDYTGPETCHRNPSIAYMRYCRHWQELTGQPLFEEKPEALVDNVIHSPRMLIPGA